MEFHDDAGRLVVVGPPSRIVSLVPSLTELVCRLGLAHRLVGVTRYCTEPAAIVAHLPRVGGTKNPDVARIAALRPDLVLVNSEENRLEDFQALVDAQLAVWVSHPRTVRAAARSIARMGAVLGADDRAAAVASEIEAALADPPPRRVRVFCPIWRNPWMAFNADTFAGDLLSCAGGDNVCAGRAERYPVVELDEIRRADPQVILLPDEPYRFADRHRAALEPLSGTSAGRDGRMYLVDGKALSWYGHRTGPALRTLRRLLGD